jgi:NAD(P)-dependent dehydrogenase (short-subunit alcohol dehydrogenase family)
MYVFSAPRNRADIEEEDVPILEGQSAIVTGGGTGIGQGIARALARDGANVAVCGRREQPLGRTCGLISDEGGSCLAVRADVSSVEDVYGLVQATMDTFGAVDVLVNNAGIGGGGRIHEHDIDTWDEVMSINLRGPFLLARSVLPIMRDQRRGHIINISSESGIEHYRGNGAYGVSKHALNALSEFIQRENQEWGIRVDTICPGMVVTEMTESTPELDRRKCLYPQDIADLVLWLLTRRANVKIGTPILIQTMENPWS